MIIIICSICREGVSITKKGRRACPCGRAFGYYREEGAAVLSPYALPLGIANESIKRGFEERPQTGWGLSVEALILPAAGLTIDHSNLLLDAQKRSPNDTASSEDVPSE